MKLPAGIQKWGVVVLGVVSLLLVINLVAQYREMEPGHSHPHPVKASGPPTRVAKVASHATGDLAKYDPDIHFAALKALDSRPFPDEERNPFEFVGGPPPPISQAAAAPGAPKVAPAPPPPPPPLAAAGYNELPGGVKEAMITFTDGERKGDIVTVHEGDVIGTKIKVTKIDSTKVVIEDGDTHQTFELPFPQ
jgi:hypothetical protein